MSEAVATPTTGQIYKIALASIIGSVIEQYNFLVTGVIAATVWGGIFFKLPSLAAVAAAITVRSWLFQVQVSGHVALTRCSANQTPTTGEVPITVSIPFSLLQHTCESRYKFIRPVLQTSPLRCIGTNPGG